MAHQHDQLACFDLQGRLLCKKSGAAPRIDLEAWLSGVARLFVRPEVNLVFVPDLVQAAVDSSLLHVDKQEVFDILVSLHRGGVIELQPESGLGRLTRKQLALCPPGPQNTVLSFARLVGQGRG